MRRGATRVGVALLFVACGGRYGSEDGPPVVDDSMPEASAPTDASNGADVAFDAADAADPDSGLVGPGEVSAACLRLASGYVRLPDTHIISIYEGTTSGSAAAASASVKVTGKDVTLVLTSFSALTWKVTLDAGASVKRVFLEANGANIASTSVTGLPTAVPITTRSVAAYARGYTREANSGGGDYVSQIAALRAEIGGLETTYQGIYTGNTFTVGGPATAKGIEYYDTREVCASPCARSGTVTQWTSVGGNATISGLTATTSALLFFGTNLRTANGARCGKHYFELQTDPAAYVGIAGVGETQLLSSNADALSVPASSRVGVAVDYELGTIVYTTQVGAGAPITKMPTPFGVWYRDAQGPALYTSGQGTITLITRAPFALPVPNGYAADY